MMNRNPTNCALESNNLGIKSRLKSLSSLALKMLQKHKIKLVASCLLSLPAWYCFSPTSFYQAWLSKDQQAMLYFKQGNVKEAALLFEEPEWKAYSTYLSGDFTAAIELLKVIGIDRAQFALANAYAHSMQFELALPIYESFKGEKGFGMAAKNNIAVIKMAIEKIKNAPPEKKGTERFIDDRQTVRDEDKEVKSKRTAVTDQLWLKQVRQNPSTFLRQKFQQEYANEHL
ncbi:hypothetical protein [Vibrio sp. B1FIG11]|uniref:hypothetical protein n=1 Tax=Vibrio sp. B1FIG11 TaxID=2751177 RepID=UPI001BB006AC|nr:hypothetical protein [Vibrio sp. B1FIG11]